MNNELIEKTSIFQKGRNFAVKYSSQIKTVFKAIILSLIATAIICPIFGINGFSIVSSFLQYVTVILAMLAWNNTRKLLETREKTHYEVDENDVILTISLTNTDVKKDVEDYLKMHPELSSISPIVSKDLKNGDDIFPTNKYMHMYINEINGAFSIKKDETNNAMPDESEGIKDYLDEFRRCIQKVHDTLAESSASKLHVFISAPIELSAFITSLFVNQKSVIMYRKVSGKQYVQMGDAASKKL